MLRRGPVLYLRPTLSSRRKRQVPWLVSGFLVAIVAVNWVVFFGGTTDVAAPSLEDRLSTPVAMPEIAPVQTPVPGTPDARKVEGSLNRGESPSQLLVRLGATPQSAREALAQASQEVDMRVMRVGQRMAADLDPQGQVLSLQVFLDALTTVEVRRSREGEWEVARREAPVDREVVQVACLIDGNLYDSLQQCGLDPAVGPRVADLLSGQIDFFSEVRRGDVLRLRIQKESAGGQFLRYGRVESLLYEGRVASAGVFSRVGSDGTVSYFDADGVPVERPFVRAPLKYTRVSSQYSLNRLHPILKTYRPHKAVDYAAPTGTPVHSVGEGRVVFLGRRGAAGNTVVIQHEHGLQTYYAHLSSFAKGLRVGDVVRQQQLIGAVGSTGRSTGPHLHFAVARNGSFIDPRVLREIRGNPLPDPDRDEFRAEVANQVALLKALPIQTVDRRRF
ncbi:MAG TPA: M23 family metallopeptidase [Myxococcota bacterium]|nr:M23 family metallopeptidase [Myxococcota bacterium]HQK50140.1 M23 family metallopeptidase [Myxococcota bacterium]